MKKLILHLGLHKTGTTAIQTCLAESRKALLAQGYCYPFTKDSKGKRVSHHHDLAHAIAGQDSGLTDDDVNTCIRHWLEIDEDRIHTFILSSESMSRHRIRSSDRNWISERRAYLNRLREKFSGFQLIPVVVLRRQDDYIRSLYQEHVRKGTTGGSLYFDEFRDQRQRTSLRFLDNLQLIEECLGKPIVLTYEELLISGDLPLCFLARLGIDIDGIDNAGKRSRRIRSSLSPVETRLKLYINQHGSCFSSNDEAMDWLQSGSGRRCLRKMDDAREIWESADIRKAFLEQFMVENRTIRERYCPDHTHLFPHLEVTGNTRYRHELSPEEKRMVDRALLAIPRWLLMKRYWTRFKRVIKRWLS